MNIIIIIVNCVSKTENHTTYSIVLADKNERKKEGRKKERKRKAIIILH